MTLHADSATQAIEELITVARARGPRCAGVHVIGIDGPSGAGKSSLTTLVAARLHEQTGEHPTVVHLDQIYPGWDGLAEGIAEFAKSALEPLSRGELAAYHRWDWNEDRYAEWVPVFAGDSLVIEGCGAGARQLAAHMSALAFVEAQDHVRYERAMARDRHTYEGHWEQWAAQERAVFASERTRDRADVVLDTTTLTLPDTGAQGHFPH